MILALIDNGSLEPAAHWNLRRIARELGSRLGTTVHAVSWKHSNRIPAVQLDGTPAWTLSAFVRAMVALGQRDFVFVPFFISAQGAIGSALRTDLETLQADLGGFSLTFTAGLAERGVIPGIVADGIRRAIGKRPGPERRLPVVVVDHGGPSAASARLRDEISTAVRGILEAEIGPLVGASMEGAHPPLLEDQLRARGFAGHDVIVAPLFLSPGRHAGPEGDIARICATSPARCTLTDLVGHHPATLDALASALRDTLATLHAQPFA